MIDLVAVAVVLALLIWRPPLPFPLGLMAACFMLGFSTARAHESWKRWQEAKRKLEETQRERFDVIAELHGHPGKACWLGCCDANRKS